MTALPARGGQPTRGTPAPLLRDDFEELLRRVDKALTAHNALARTMSTCGVVATARALGISRATAHRFRNGQWPVTEGLHEIAQQLRAGP